MREEVVDDLEEMLADRLKDRVGDGKLTGDDLPIAVVDATTLEVDLALDVDELSLPDNGREETRSCDDSKAREALQEVRDILGGLSLGDDRETLRDGLFEAYKAASGGLIEEGDDGDV